MNQSSGGTNCRVLDEVKNFHNVSILPKSVSDRLAISDVAMKIGKKVITLAPSLVMKFTNGIARLLAISVSD